MAWPVPQAGKVRSWRPVSVPVSSSTAGSSAAGWTPVASSSVSTAPAAAACADSSGPAPCPPAVKSASAGATASPPTPASAAETPSDREPDPLRATERIASLAASLSVVGPCMAAGRAVVTTAKGVPSSRPRQQLDRGGLGGEEVGRRDDRSVVEHDGHRAPGGGHGCRREWRDRPLAAVEGEGRRRDGHAGVALGYRDEELDRAAARADPHDLEGIHTGRGGHAGRPDGGRGRGQGDRRGRTEHAAPGPSRYHDPRPRREDRTPWSVAYRPCASR